jgi:uncharacterized cupredoxin-like copper-binding protein
MQRRTLTQAAAAAALALPAGRLLAHGSAGHGDKNAAAAPAAPPEQTDWGIAGERKAVRRTIEVKMIDTMRFVPDRIEVRLNETVRFVVRNDGRILHEMVIGTPAELERHNKLMEQHPNMEHEEPYMAHVDPGKSGEIVWRFNRAGSFQFACLVPGHYRRGMVGTIVVRP